MNTQLINRSTSGGRLPLRMLLLAFPWPQNRRQRALPGSWKPRRSCLALSASLECPAAWYCVGVLRCHCILVLKGVRAVDHILSHGDRIAAILFFCNQPWHNAQLPAGESFHRRQLYSKVASGRKIQRRFRRCPRLLQVRMVSWHMLSWLQRKGIHLE